MSVVSSVRCLYCPQLFSNDRVLERQKHMKECQKTLRILTSASIAEKKKGLRLQSLPYGKKLKSGFFQCTACNRPFRCSDLYGHHRCTKCSKCCSCFTETDLELIYSKGICTITLDGFYRCNRCDSICLNRELFEDHIASHAEYLCELTLSRHTRKQNGISEKNHEMDSYNNTRRLFCCNLCGVECRGILQLQKHCLVHHHIDRVNVSCLRCNYAFPSRLHAVRHFMEHWRNSADSAKRQSPISSNVPQMVDEGGPNHVAAIVEVRTDEVSTPYRHRKVRVAQESKEFIVDKVKAENYADTKRPIIDFDVNGNVDDLSLNLDVGFELDELFDLQQFQDLNWSQVQL